MFGVKFLFLVVLLYNESVILCINGVFLNVEMIGLLCGVDIGGLFLFYDQRELVVGVVLFGYIVVGY